MNFSPTKPKCDGGFSSLWLRQSCRPVRKQQKRVHQRIGSAKVTDFVTISSLPRREDGEIDWLAVPEETRIAFGRSHKRTWIEPTLVNFDDNTSEGTSR
jgi:hypothetical protein